MINAAEKKVAVMDLSAKAGVDAVKAATLTDILCAAIKDIGEYKVISREDIRAMLMHVQDQQLLGCDDTRCLAEIGGALGVPLLVFGNIGMLGDTYVINLKLIDIDNADVVNRISEKYSGPEGGLIDHLEYCTRVLFGKEKSKIPFFKRKSVRFGFLSAGVISVVTSLLYYANANSIHENEYSSAGSKEDEEKYWDRIKTSDTMANVFLSASGVFFAGGIITFAF